ncbi:MAG: sulfatase [Thermogutta sp.]|uniref:sulfatase n=1 Tax=Thermogutta sp. TaxID=1962930 RepID=UPI0019AA03B3|nr:sulfatase [Thermogutta sp.]MBC7351641.1 sulfatase [Thermogutta sp.]
MSVLWGLLLATCLTGEVQALPDTSHMNVLLIDIEDCNAAALGCYGNPICKTPNLDRFTKTAVRFDRAYVQAVCCNPSRASFLTGLRPLTTRVTRNEQEMDAHLPEGVLTLPEYLKAKGFYLAVIGKLFHRTDYAEKQLSVFDRIEMYTPPPGWKGPGPIIKFPPVPRPADWQPPPKDQKSREYREWRRRQSDRYGDSGRTREQEGDYRMAATAAALLKEFAKSKQQFFLAVAQSRPHTPLICPKQYIDMYDPAQIPDPPAPPESLVNFPYPKRAFGGNPDIFTLKQPTRQQAKEAIAAYYACLTFVDDNIGMILDALEETGLDKNTIVIFLGDHGFHLGDHGFWSKYSMLEATHRAPLIVRVPGAPANGKTCDEIVEFVDLVPTLGELLKLDLPKNLEGISFAPLLVNPQRPWKKAAFIVEDDGDAFGECVRTKKYSYMELKKGAIPAALYDLEKDPWETRNVVDDPAYEQVRKEMADLLHAGWKAALPPGVTVP